MKIGNLPAAGKSPPSDVAPVWAPCRETRGGLTCERCMEPIRAGDPRYWLAARVRGVDTRHYWRRLCRWCGESSAKRIVASVR